MNWENFLRKFAEVITDSINAFLCSEQQEE